MKRILLILSTLMLLSGITMAAPILDIQQDHPIVGLSYWNPALNDSSKSRPHQFIGVYGEAASSDNKSIIGLDYSTGNLSNYKINSGSVGASKEFNMLDLNLNYKVNRNIQIITGDRVCFNSITIYDNYGENKESGFHTDHNTTNTFFYGAGVTAKIGTNDVYASSLHSKNFTDKQAGVNFNIKKNWSLNVNYRQYRENSSILQAFGGGVGYKF